MNQDAPMGVLLMVFGGPDSRDAIEPFVTRLLGGRKLPPPAMEKIKARYELIGGKSPLPETTRQQAKLVEEKLRAEGGNFKAYVGMCYSHPLISEAMQEMAKDGVKEVIALSLSPHYAKVTTGAYEREIKAALEETGVGIKVINAGGWYDHPLYIEALADNIKEALKSFAPDRQAGVQFIFSAHSLPVSHIEGGDPYVDQIKSTIAKVVSKMNIENWQLAYQSKGGGQEPWLGPEVEEVLDTVKASGQQDVLVVPVSFASDHIETLYDIDILQQKHADELGLNFARAAALNTSPKFIAALADVARNTCK